MASATRGSSGSVILFIERLNKYLYFYEKGVPQITVESIKDLIELVKSEMQGDDSHSDPAANAFFASTLRYIQFQNDKGGSIGDKCKLITFLHKEKLRAFANKMKCKLHALDVFGA